MNYRDKEYTTHNDRILWKVCSLAKLRKIPARRIAHLIGASPIEVTEIYRRLDIYPWLKYFAA